MCTLLNSYDRFFDELREEIQSSPLFCANIAKKDPGRARRNSLATAGTNFTKPGAHNKGDLCMFVMSDSRLCTLYAFPTWLYHPITQAGRTVRHRALLPSPSVWCAQLDALPSRPRLPHAKRDGRGRRARALFSERPIWPRENDGRDGRRGGRPRPDAAR